MAGQMGVRMKSIWKKIKQSLAAGKPQMPQSGQKSVENIYDNPKLKELAYLCKMGDITAMLEMAYFFRDCCEKPLRELLDAYEQNPVQQNEDMVDQYLTKSNSEVVRTVKAYVMWLVRAALYGNGRAGMLLERCPYYKKRSYIPYAVLIGDGYESIWDSDSLWETGMIDMVRGCTDCRLELYREKGYFELWYVDHYYPPDDDGFGAEYEYASAYYNEFFCRIPVKEEKEISRQMMLLEKEREAYWNKPEHNASERRYKRRLCTQG